MRGDPGISAERLCKAYAAAREELLSLRKPDGWWEGELSPSAVSTAIAASALSIVNNKEYGDIVSSALEWLAADQNGDGGWGDTPDSPSNLTATVLARAAFQLGREDSTPGGGETRFSRIIENAEGYISKTARVSQGVDRSRRRALAEAIKALYAPDHTFSVPVLCNMALAGLADWETIPSLPFELAALPRWFLSGLQLQVVSYALPALIAVGRLQHVKGCMSGVVARAVRSLLTSLTLHKLERLQPESGGFIEAAPLTGFVVMSLAAAGHPDHPVVRRGVDFLLSLRHHDGSWPIDSNLSVWVTTEAVAALSGAGMDSLSDAMATRRWLLAQQHLRTHPYTGARPGGWSWTHLSGGAPDVDDTSGALIAIHALKYGQGMPYHCGPDGTDADAVSRGIRWLLGLQNSDGGWPTFCRGWGRLPFDRSSPDLTAHAMRAIRLWNAHITKQTMGGEPSRIGGALARGFACLERTQRPDGAWIPLWFGNQAVQMQENPVLGTARGLTAYRDLGQADAPPARRAEAFLLAAQNHDGGWGGAKDVPSSVEETALAVEALVPGTGKPPCDSAWQGGRFLVECVESGRFRNTLPIGLYFAKLWYSERLYPIIWTVGALGRLVAVMRPSMPPAPAHQTGDQEGSTPSGTPAAEAWTTNVGRDLGDP